MSLLRGVLLDGAALKLLQTRPSVSEPIEEECVLLLPDRGGSLKRLHQPQLFRA